MRVVKWAFFLSLLMGACLLLVTIRVQQWQAGYRLGDLEQQLQQLREQDRALSIELSMLKRPQRITELASRRLGLAPAKMEQMQPLVQKEP